ncbi:cohesin domain-containing protein, partial [Clostridium paraputrificum]|uniref:cohesin domain-containing protein n=1 Tax=Clostridium paraputrificum TaxID=29363 RepID=UPI00356345D5
MKFYSKKLKKFFAMICAFCLIVEFSLSGIQVKAAEPTPKVTYTVTGETTVGKQITINLNVSNINGLYGGSWDFAYDPSILKIDEITSGELTSSILQITTSNKSGHAYFWFTKTGDTTGVSNTEAKSVAKIKATVLKEGTININTTNSDNSFGVNNKSSLVKLSDKNGDKISYSSKDKSISCVKPIVILQPGTYYNKNTNLTYSGSWKHADSQSYSNSKNASISFSFEGTGFALTSLAASNRGIAKVYIDGVAYNADGYNSSTQSKIVFSKDGLAFGKHDV